MKLTFLGMRVYRSRKPSPPHAHLADGGVSRTVVAGDEREIRGRLRHMADQRGVQAEIVHDGMDVVLR